MNRWLQKQIAKINLLRVNMDHKKLKARRFDEKLAHAICKKIITEETNKSNKIINDIDIFQNQCLKISLKAFHYFLIYNVPVKYAIGYFCYNGKEFFRCDYKSISKNMINFDSSMRYHVHAWLLIEDRIIVDFTLLATIEGKMKIIVLPEPDQSNQLQYFPIILTSTPFDLLEKLGFYLAE